MANLSQIRREQMISFLETLKEQHSDDESLMAINQIEKELKAAPFWYSLNQNMDIYLRDTLMSNLEAGFRKFEAKEEERRKEQAIRDKEEGERVQRLYEELQRKEAEYDHKITITVGEPIPITNEDTEKEG